MAARVIIGIVALSCTSLCGIMATLAHQSMVAAVNGRLLEVEQFQPLGWYWEKTQRLNRDYRRLFPEGRLHLKIRVLGASMLVCILICMWAIGFFSL